MGDENIENLKKLSGKLIQQHASIRNPLGDLPSNDNAVNIRKITRSISTVKTLNQNDKSRAKSASAIETKVKYSLKTENITERQSNNEVVSNVDEVFIEGEEHFLNYLPENKPSHCVQDNVKAEDVKITQTLPVVRVSGEIRKPAKKLTLARKLSSRSKRFKIDEIYRDCLYDVEYFEDNYRYMLQQERNFVYRKSYMQKYADEKYRMCVVNWLIYAQQILDLSENTYFVAIRMFDYLLISTNVVSSKYVLLGIVCMWIANKNLDVHYIQVPKLFAICNQKFSKQQILSTEKEILKALKFNVNFSEPASFLYYYVKTLHLENNLKVRNGAMFLLEAFTLSLEFSSLTPSLLASVAFYLVLLKYKIEDTSFLRHVEKYILDIDMFKNKSEQLRKSVEHLLKCKCVSNEVIAKYSVEDRDNVAQDFTTE